MKTMLLTVAAILGVLIASEPVTTVGGQLGWKCTYSVNGQTVEVFEKQLCKPSMWFN